MFHQAHEANRSYEVWWGADGAESAQQIMLNLPIDALAGWRSLPDLPNERVWVWRGGFAVSDDT